MKKMYTLSVPCITQFIIDDSAFDVNKLPDKLFISEDCICRCTNDSVLLLNGLYQAFYSKELSHEYFKDGYYLRKKDFAPSEISQLIRKKIINLSSNGEKSPQVFKYQQCISPYYATVEVTQQCNAFCAHCYNGYERTSNDPPLETILNRINHLHNMGILYVELTGGEPLLRRDINDIVDYIANKKMKFCLATNGYFISKHFSVIKNAECVAISLDGDRNYHNHLRGIDIYDRVLEALKIMQEKNIRGVISMTVTPENVQHIQHVVDIAQEYEAELILAAVVPAGKSEKKEVLQKLHADPFISGTDKKIYGDSIQRPKQEVNKNTYYYGCDMGRKGFTINIDGEILPCLFLRSFSIGHLDTFSVAKYNEIIDKLCIARRRLATTCEHCSEHTCGGPCIFSNTHKTRQKKQYPNIDAYLCDMKEEAKNVFI